MLTADFILQPRKDLEVTLSSLLPEEAIPQALEAVANAQPASTLNGVTGVIVRVKSIKIIDNARNGLGSFLGGNPPADIYPLILVANGGDGTPIEFALPNMFNGIRDGDFLPIAEPGLAVQRNFNKVPAFLDIHILIMRSRKAQREFASAIDQALNSNEGKSLVSAINTLVSGANPVAGIALNATASLLQLVLKFLGAQNDTQIFYGVGSLERKPDALGVGRQHVFEDKRFASVVVEVLGI